MDFIRTVCFTGHRDLDTRESRNLKKRLREEIERRIGEGAVCFRAGGARGFDTLAAEAVLEARSRHSGIELELILPFPDQTVGWSRADVREYDAVLTKADRVLYVSDAFYQGVYQLRDRRLVDGSDVCVAYLRSSKNGGTAYTAAYALRSGLEFTNLYNE